MSLLRCPYLQGDIELTDERERHIATQHPDLLPAYRDKIVKTLAARSSTPQRQIRQRSAVHASV